MKKLMMYSARPQDEDLLSKGNTHRLVRADDFSDGGFTRRGKNSPPCSAFGETQLSPATRSSGVGAGAQITTEDKFAWRVSKKPQMMTVQSIARVRIFSSIKIFLSVSLFFILAGCGFHLRQTTALPVFAQTVYFNTPFPYSALTRQIKASLRNAHAELADEPKKALITLNVLNESFLVQQNSLASSQQTRSYQLIYTVTYSVQAKNGRTLADQRTLTAQSSLALFPNEQVVGNTKIDQAKEWMEQDLVSQLITQLAALQNSNSSKSVQRKSS